MADPAYDAMDHEGKQRDLVSLLYAENIADDMDKHELASLGQKVKREFEVDEQSRGDWKTRMNEAINLAKQIVESKNYPWPNAANVKYPLITTATIQFAARAYPAIIQGRNIVKGQVRGDDSGIPMEPAAQLQAFGTPEQPSGQMPPVPQEVSGEGMQPGVSSAPPQGAAPPASSNGPLQAQFDQAHAQPQQWQVEPGAKRARADRIGRHMSYQLLDEMEEWEDDTDQLLHILPIIGSVFRKTWFDPNLGRNRSELVLAEDLVVNYKAKWGTAPRASQCFTLYPHEIEERFRMGIYREFELPQTGEANDDQPPHEFIEQHRRDDLDGDGYAEPYIVTQHVETGEVVRIVARFDEEGIHYDDSARVAKIEPVSYFTRYIFMPSPDGGVYGYGFGALLRPINEAINTAINQMLDAGHLQNTGGGFIGGGLRIRGGTQTFRPGEYKRVTSVSGSLRDNVLALDFPGPAPTMFQLLGLLIEAGRDISSVKDIMTGDEGPQGEAAARTLARIEQGMKVFSAIYKRVYRSLKQEYKKLFRLNRLYMQEQQYFTLLDDPEAAGRADYEDTDLDVAPVADPGMVTDMQKAAHAEFLFQFAQDPYFEPIELRRRILEVVGIPEINRLVVKESPPNPEIMLKADELEIRKKEISLQEEEMVAKVAEVRSKIILNLAKAEEAADKAEIAALSEYLGKIMDERKMAIEARKMEVDADERKMEIEARKAEIDVKKAESAKKSAQT